LSRTSGHSRRQPWRELLQEEAGVTVVWRGVFWIIVYLALVLTPLFVLLIQPVPSGGGFYWDLGVAFGFAGTTMLALMFVLTARFRRATAPFGIDLIYYFHRQISLWACAFIIAHPILIFYADPRHWQLLHPGVIPWHLAAAILSLAALLALMITSLWRKPLHIHYDGWRMWHAFLAVAALTLALAHMVGSGHFILVPWKRQLWVAIALTCLALIFYVRLVKPAMMLRRPYRVERVIPERGDAWTLVVRPVEHQGLHFRPGQFAWLTLRSSPFALKEHPFSFSSSANEARELSFTIKALGDFTSRIGTVRPGERVYLDGPYGAFSTDRHPHAPGFVFIAGGIGIAPVMSMLRTLADRHDRRPMQLIYAYKNLERLTFAEELEQLQKRLHLRTVIVLAEPPAGWQGETGFINAELLGRHLATPRDRHVYFICGPVPMIAASEQALHQLEVPLHKIHSELFDLV
jgi:predicted ferric reductase